jgi:hypothetical protein
MCVHGLKCRAHGNMWVRAAVHAAACNAGGVLDLGDRTVAGSAAPSGLATTTYLGDWANACWA